MIQPQTCEHTSCLSEIARLIQCAVY